jgi:hypothetical protein
MEAFAEFLTEGTLSADQIRLGFFAQRLEMGE